MNRSHIFALLTVVAILPSLARAATGDILFQCDFSGGTASDPKSVISACPNSLVGRPTVFNSGPQHVTTIPATGGWNNGSYIRTEHSNASTTDDCDMLFMARPSKTGVTEWTVTYFEKFESWPIATPNIKSSRIYHSHSDGYYGALIGAHMNYNGGMYLNPWESADVRVEPSVVHKGIVVGPRYGSTDLTGTALQCNGSPATWPFACVASINPGQYRFPGPPVATTKASDILSFNWTTDNGVTSGYGANRWHKLRLHTKLPSTDTAADGAITLWIDEKLAFTATKVKSSDAAMEISGYPGAGGATFTGVKFYPSDDAKSPFVHSYDDIVIYEGLVTPSGPVQSSPKPAIPQNLLAR